MQVKDASKQRWQELELHRESAVGFMHINWERIVIKFKCKVYTRCVRNCLTYVSKTLPMKRDHMVKLDRT